MIDLDGDAVPDLVVLEASGPKVFINNTSGSLSLASTKTVPQSKAIEVTDINRDGYKDLVIATSGGVSIQLADTHLSWPSTQTIQSGDTENLLLHDFDNDGYSDLVTVDSSGTVRFYKNRRSQGFAEVGGPVQLHGYGNMLVQDADNDGQMDVVVEIAPGVNEIVSVGSIFGIQPIQPGGKRSVRYVLFDHLGSAKMLINDQCEVVWPDYGIREVNKLLPFGQERLVRLNSSEIAYNLNFTNKELDRDLELNYFGARYYHPEIPRFISPDPVGGKLEIPTSWNRYLYCRNDPVNMFDPDGNDPFTAANQSLFQKIYKDSGGAHLPPEYMVVVLQAPGKEMRLEIAKHNTNNRGKQTLTFSQYADEKVIALIHTHTDELKPRPTTFKNKGEESDQAAAEKLDAPVYAITNKGEMGEIEGYEGLQKVGVYKIIASGEITLEEPDTYLHESSEAK